jgi:hypothetical protein
MDYTKASVSIAAAVVMGMLTGCSMEETTSDVKGVWEIASLTADKPVSPALYDAWVKPLIGTKLYVYGDGIVKAVCVNDAGVGGPNEIVGRYYIHPDDGTVSFNLDSKTSCWVSMCLVRCKFEGPDKLVMSHPDGRLVLKRSKETVGDPPTVVPAPWDGTPPDPPRATSSDGKAFLPGRSGEFPPGEEDETGPISPD